MHKKVSKKVLANQIVYEKDMCIFGMNDKTLATIIPINDS